jgi:hypothetical protein
MIKSKSIRYMGHVAHMGEMRNAYKMLVAKPEETRLLRRPRSRWEDNIKMYLQEIGWEVVNWIHMAQDKDWC